MKKLLILAVCAASASFVRADSYNQTITAIFGAGNPDTGWAADTGNGITLGLRGKNRDTGATPNAAGVYSFATGLNAAANRALWNYEFSIDSGTPTLSFYDFYLGVDMDASAGISFAYVNPFTAYDDNSFGNAGTANGQGIEGTPAGNSALANSNFIAQNSQNIVFIGQNPFLNATYNYELFAVAKGAGVAGPRLVDVGITVVVGSGGSAVPDSGISVILIGATLIGFALVRRKVA
ncbi:MAG TPA: hypothetical protein VG734_27255 [Lacunisphaera sp.]|nr:hypothetical protein [Lacunisphaera sp.]